MRRLGLLLVLLAALGCRRGEPPSQTPPAAPPDPEAAHRLPLAGPVTGADGGVFAPQEDPHAGHQMPGPAPDIPPPPEGYAMVQIPEDRQRLIGLRVAQAEQATVTGTIRTAAQIQPVETQEVSVQSKISGWIEELFAGAVGDQVRQGQPLYSIYSQELLVAQSEYLRARRTNRELAAAARERLLRWDIPPDQLRAIEQRGPLRAVTFPSPVSGTVLERRVLEGQFVSPGTVLFRIADLSQVWILAEVYEYEADRIRRGAPAQVYLEGRPEPFTATVDYVYPTVDPVSRTVRLRLVAQNPQGQLRPGAFASVELPTRPVEALWVPEEAVIDTGVRQVVFLALGDGYFHPVEVRVGRRMEGRAEVLEGLQPGQQVVMGAQFLLDSESRLRGQQPGVGGAHGGH